MTDLLKLHKKRELCTIFVKFNFRGRLAVVVLYVVNKSVVGLPMILILGV